MKKAFSVFVCTMLSLFSFTGCNKEDVHNGRTPLATIAENSLYKDEVDIMYAIYGHGADSVAFYKEYIERWAIEQLFYKKATENVAATDDIEKMVDSYRRGLILSVYQDRLIEQQLISDISESDIQQFYDVNENMFELEEPMFKGLFLKLPDRSPGMNKVRTWCIRKSSDDLEELEKYSLANHVTYDSFIDDWRTVAEVANLTPITEYQLNERLKRKETIEFREDGYTYFISADTLIQKSDRKPVEMVSAEIVDLLVNSRKADFIKEKKLMLYDEAIIKGDVVIF